MAPHMDVGKGSDRIEVRKGGLVLSEGTGSHLTDSRELRSRPEGLASHF